ncbi:MAG TPA: chemotaxis protein [Azospirillaceae bacterium]|nr:chemotaxis protein [Azospirillaceae bacterium]
MVSSPFRRPGDKKASGGYYHPHYGADVIKVMLGEHKVSTHPEVMLVTTLGSCVAACVRDPVALVGGMNHFLLPDVPENSPGGVNDAARYGSVAMEFLINNVLSQGARRNRLQIKVFGGAKVIDSSYDVGAQNAAFVLDYIEREGLELVGQDLGGTQARRVHFYPVTGRAMRKLLRPEAMNETIHHELSFRSKLRAQRIEGDVELFGD